MGNGNCSTLVLRAPILIDGVPGSSPKKAGASSTVTPLRNDFKPSA